MKRLIMIAAAALAATVIAAPVAAQTTGMLQVLAGPGFEMPLSVRLNSNREWEVQYTFTFNQAAANGSITVCNLFSSSCEIKSPYIMRYGAIDGYSKCRAGQDGPTQSQINGINARLGLNSWQQTLRARPSQDYCLALFSSVAGSYYNTYPFVAVGFRTPADPNPPASPWNPNSLGAGCGAETSLDLVQQCYRCKYQGTAETWNFDTNRCVSAGS